MPRFEQQYGEWSKCNLENENNPRRRELLGKGLGHGTVEFLRAVWFPAIGNFDHLYPEWEVRDFNNGYRYLDLAYMPRNVKGGIVATLMRKQTKSWHIITDQSPVSRVPYRRD